MKSAILIVCALLLLVSATAVCAEDFSQWLPPLRAVWSVTPSGLQGLASTDSQSWAMAQNLVTQLTPAGWSFGSDIHFDNGDPRSGWGPQGNIGLMISNPSTQWYDILAQVLVRNEGLYIQVYNAVSGANAQSAPIARTDSMRLTLSRAPGASTLSAVLTNALGGSISLNTPFEYGLDSYTMPGLICYNGDATFSNIAITSVPEPGSMLALLSGLCGLGGLALRRRK